LINQKTEIMKKLFVAFLVLINGLAMAQTHSEKISRELTFEKKSPDNALMIFNINGDVKVTGYAGDKILVEVEKVIRGKTETRLQNGKEEIQLGVVDRADSLFLYVKGVCSEFGQLRKKENWQRKWNGWGYNWNDCGRGNNCDKDYDYEMNFTIKVPMGTNIFASTVNEGDVEIGSTTGYVLADNVNGSIRLKGIEGPTNASTINGDVDLDYSKNPIADCRYYSLNGDINAYFIKGLAAQVSFDSFNGDFYTNVEQLENVPVTLEKKETGKGIKYKVSGSRYRVGKGSAMLLDFETFNGNVYLKEKN
jgi:DUF4097 and DUF4098 domain-containing protein YvlB